jgi:5-methylcytosine-specific restriction endonuclease McrA
MDVEAVIREWMGATRRARQMNRAEKPELPAMDREQAEAAREEIRILYYGSVWGRQVSRSAMFAVEVAELRHATERGQKPGKKQALRDRIIERDGSDCWLCQQPLDGDATFEHKTPRSAGGTWHIDNLALAHTQCNRDLGRLPEKAKEAARAAIAGDR